MSTKNNVRSRRFLYMTHYAVAVGLLKVEKIDNCRFVNETLLKM